jgi:hypothetical protein
MWLGVNWGDIALVFGVALVATVLVVTLYSLALRLLGSYSTGGDSTAGAHTRPPAITALAWLLIAVSAAAVLYGVYLVIPLFHSS